MEQSINLDNNTPPTQEQSSRMHTSTMEHESHDNNMKSEVLEERQAMDVIMDEQREINFNKKQPKAREQDRAREQQQYESDPQPEEEWRMIRQSQQAQTKLQAEYCALQQAHTTIKDSKDTAQIAVAIKEYCLLLAQHQTDQIFFQYNNVSYNKFLSLLLNTLRAHRYSSQLIRAVFTSMEYLLKAIKGEEQLVYLMVAVEREGFAGEKYQFAEEEDAAYYANFLKLLVRKINSDEKYLSIFFNPKQPQFPLLLSLFRFHSSPDTVLCTSSRLAILQLSNNQNKAIQKYMLNFPFILIYPYYLQKVVNAIDKTIKPNATEEEKEEANEEVRCAVKYLEQFVQGKGKEVVEMYTNTFMSMIGRKIYSQIANATQQTLPKIRQLMKLTLNVCQLQL